MGGREFREVCEFREFNELSENLLPNLPKFLNLPKNKATLRYDNKKKRRKLDAFYPTHLIYRFLSTIRD